MSGCPSHRSARRRGEAPTSGCTGFVQQCARVRSGVIGGRIGPIGQCHTAVVGQPSIVIARGTGGAARAEMRPIPPRAGRQTERSSMPERSYTVSVNRQAYHDYFVEEKLEAGVALTGTEVKSIRAGR